MSEICLKVIFYWTTVQENIIIDNITASKNFDVYDIWWNCIIFVLMWTK